MSLLFDERNDLENLCKYLRKCEHLYMYCISVNSCRNNYSFFGLWVRQLFKGDNYSREKTVN